MRAWLFVAAALLALAGSRAEAFENCMQANYLEYFVADLAPEPCTLIASYAIVTVHGRSELRVIRIDRSAHGDDSVWAGHTELLAIALGPAIDAIGTARLPETVTVLLTDDTRVVGGLRAHAVTNGMIEFTDTAGRIVTRDCAVPFYKLDTVVPVQEFMVAVAHELFHCAQSVTWTDAFNGASPHWWREGSAEYFSHLAVPGTRLRDGWFDGFDQVSRERSLLEMRYENVVFFMWLANRGDPAAEGAFLDRMTAGDQLATMRDLVSLADWREFVEAYIDGRITRPSGGALPAARSFNGERRFRGPGDLVMQAEDYVIRRWRVIFETEKLYKLTLNVGSGAPEVAMRLDDLAGTWAPIPTTVSTCEAEKHFIAYALSVDSPGEATLAVATDDDLTGGACCLVGHWSPTQASLDATATLSMELVPALPASAGASMSCGYTSGGWVQSFGDDGAGQIGFEANTNTCTLRGQAEAMSMASRNDGALGFDWTIAEEGVGIATYGANTLSHTITMRIGPMTQSHPGADSGPVMASNGFHFTCEGDDLTIMGLYGLMTGEATHMRFAE